MYIGAAQLVLYVYMYVHWNSSIQDTASAAMSVLLRLTEQVKGRLMDANIVHMNESVNGRRRRKKNWREKIVWVSEQVNESLSERMDT